jgi:peptidyl-prolyl cis-trans isomerase SurA
MNKTFILIFTIFLSLISAPQSVIAAEPFSIIAVVNDSAISSSDVDARMRLMLASSGLRNTKENKERMKPQAVNTLIEEELKIQEAANQQVSVSPEEISKGFETLAAQNKFTAEKFAQVLKQQGIPKSTLLSQIKSQIAWTKVIAEVLRPQIDVTEADVNARINRMKENIGQTEYLIGEIFLPVNKPSEDGKTKQLATKIIQEMKQQKVPFEVVASQFSKAPGAQQNGGMSWMQKGQLPKDLDEATMSLSKGQISVPLRGLSGYHIMMMRDVRTTGADTIPAEQDVTNQIGLERLDRLQQRYLFDVKAAAFIDHRN